VELKERQVQELSRQMMDNYGFDLAFILKEYRLSLWKRNNLIFSIPSTYLEQFPGLPFEAAGLLVGEVTPYGFVPSHEWVVRFEEQFSQGRFPLPDEMLPAWLRGEDIHGLGNCGYLSGRIVIVVDSQGRFLGRGRVQTLRLRNLLPRRQV
jgi:NOL1/NOP2/fmu family ribosome biogenesis protein